MSKHIRANIRHRQEDELVVIKAIFVGDVYNEVNIPTEPLQYTIRLLPQRGSSEEDVDSDPKVPTFLVLHVAIPLEYPQRAPDMSFGESKGLSSQEITELQTELKQMATEYVAAGEEMMYQLLSHAETFLYGHQKRPSGSFHDEMVMRQKQLEDLEEKNLRKQSDLKGKERLAIKEEIIRKQNEEREELRKIKESRRLLILPAAVDPSRSPVTSPNSPISSPLKGNGHSMSLRERAPSRRRFSTGGKRSGGYRSNSEGSDCSISDSSDLLLLDFVCGKNSTSFYRGEVLGKSERGTTVYAGMSTSGHLVAISEWKFVSNRGTESKSIENGAAGDSMTLNDVLHQIHSIEGEMNLLQKLEHKNIVLYFGMKAFPQIQEAGAITVYLVEELVRGTTLQSYLQGTLTFDIGLLRHCAKGVLEGLTYLHQNDIVHRCLRDTSVFMDSSGDVRITDYGVERQISELYRVFNKLPEVPNKFPPFIGRGGKKGDIYRFGTIILSLINGTYVQNPSDIPSVLPADLQDFLRKCLTPIDQSRWTAADLINHEFLKVHLYADSPLKLPCPQKLEEDKVKDENDHEDRDDVPQSIPNLFKGHSRVHSEFQILEFLGKGGFGDVLKVKNKLDGGVYALKRIKLNPRNKQLNKKITREVKLLSQLNHENVVRYFNSWIESVIESDGEESATTESISHEVKLQSSVNQLAVHFQSLFKKESNLGLIDNIEDMAPALGMGGDSSEWDASGSPSVLNASEEESDDSSDDDDDLFGNSFRRITMEDDDVEIVFEDSGSPTKHKNSQKEVIAEDIDDAQGSKLSSDIEIQSDAVSVTSYPRESQFLYIQMEFCEKSTLKNAIDQNLCEDLDRAWRLFREIVEGLVHIHQQGMIHRDLKPVNIFLDSNDHVKIGDFGLATSSIIPKRPDESMQDFDIMEGLDHYQSPDDVTDETRTGQVGTALYAAPELVTKGQKASYNQKVDIYSLGVIFFEIFYHPTSTAMERVRVITGLRQPVISFPKDFDQTLFPQITHITKWLLHHDHTKRPTSLELLQSDYLPPPHLEEAELRDIFSRTIRSSKTKSYKYLVASCFQQEVSPVEDATYDMDGGKNFLCKGLSSPSGNVSRSLFFIQHVKHVIHQVFERHGATELHTPLLMPKSALYEDIDTCVNLMCHSGGIVSLPRDLRVPFARYVGRYGINHLRRFAIDKVFRERKVYGLHPRELIECAFDIVDSSQGSLISDAEVLSVAFEILHELPWLRDTGCTIRLGHTKLLLGVFLHHGVSEVHYNKIAKLLSDVKNERDSQQQIKSYLHSLNLSDHNVSVLMHFLEVGGSFPNICNMLRGLMKRKGEAASYIKEALHELEILITNIGSFGIKCSITTHPGMTFCSQIYSGLLFQVVCELKRRKKTSMEIIAAGGRYDKLIHEFRSSMYLEQDGSMEGRDGSPCGVGISISLEKLIAGFDVGEEDENLGKEWATKASVDVLVCALGHHQMIKEKIDMMKDLLAHGIHASVLDASQTLESAEEFCKEIGAIFLVILKEGEYSNTIRVRLWERGRFNEKKLSKAEVIDLIWRTLHDGCNEQFSGPSGIMRSDSLSVKQSGLLGAEANYTLATANNTHAHNHPYNISIIMQEREKLPHLKRKYENQIMSRITDILAKFGRHHMVDVMGVEVNATVVNNIASSFSLSLHDKDEFAKSVGDIVEKHPRLKKYLKGICDEIFELIYEKNASVIIIFGLIDNSYRVLL